MFSPAFKISSCQFSTVSLFPSSSNSYFILNDFLFLIIHKSLLHRRHNPLSPYHIKAISSWYSPPTSPCTCTFHHHHLILPSLSSTKLECEALIPLVSLLVEADIWLCFRSHVVNEDSSRNWVLSCWLAPKIWLDLWGQFPSDFGFEVRIRVWDNGENTHLKWRISETGV